MIQSTGTTATINLDALCDNYRLLSGKTRGASAAVVKANAYGLGAVPVATALHEAGCRQFFTASLPEAVAVRAALPEVAIGVFYGVTNAEDAKLAVANQLVPVLNNPAQIACWQDAARAAGKSLPAHLHVDTGMTRVGLSMAEAEALAQDASQLAGVEMRMLLSHLACASDPEHPLNKRQLENFRKVRGWFPQAVASLANSSGIFLGEEYHFDMLRPGAALYGINPVPGENPMRTVVTIEAPVIQIRTLDAAETVGYGATYQAPKGSRLATVAAGYADGLMRSMSHRSEAYLAGRKVPLAGIVSMDLIVLDISSLPEGAVQMGDAVEFIGEHLPVDLVATRAGTIGYELFTSINSRVRRIYAREQAGRLAQKA